MHEKNKQLANKQAYRALIQRIPDFPVFAMDWYLDSVSEEGKWDVVLLEKDKQTIGAMPYFLKQKGPFSYITMPPLTKFMGPYLLPEFRGNSTYYQALFDRLPKVSSFTQNFHYPISTQDTFPLKVGQAKKFYSYRLHDIQDLVATRSRFTRYYRNAILKRAPEELTIQHHLGIDAYYELNRKTYARQGIAPPFSLKTLQKNWKALEANQAGKIFFATDNQQRIHAAALLIWDKDTAWYHSAGGDPELRKSGAGIYIVWKMIRYASEQLGLRHFDFAGSMIPAIEKIWLNFGAEKQTYFHLEHHYSKWFVATQKIINRVKKGK